MGFLNMVLSPLEEIFKPLISIFKTVLVLINLFIELLKMLPKFFYMFNYLTDPGKIISDAIYGFTTGIKMILKSIVDILMGKSVGLLNLHVKDDDSNNKKQKRDTEECVNPSLLEILILLLCPPLAIFIRKGLKGFFTIVITAVLTYYYYLPGLVYASLYVL